MNVHVYDRTSLQLHVLRNRSIIHMLKRQFYNLSHQTDGATVEGNVTLHYLIILNKLAEIL